MKQKKGEMTTRTKQKAKEETEEKKGGKKIEKKSRRATSVCTEGACSYAFHWLGGRVVVVEYCCTVVPLLHVWDVNYTTH